MMTQREYKAWVWLLVNVVVVALCMAALAACDGGGGVVGPSPVEPPEAVETRTPGPGEPGWDTLDFWVGPDVQTELQQHWVVPGVSWVLCKLGFSAFGTGNCVSHSAFHADADFIYLDEDHSMNGGRPWVVYAPHGGRGMRMMGRHARPGDRIVEETCLTWYNHGSCSVWADCHAFAYDTEVLEFVRDFDFGGGVGVRDALVYTFKGEVNVLARGVGLVHWHDDPAVARDPRYASGDWRDGPFINELRADANPANADTCVWD